MNPKLILVLASSIVDLIDQSGANPQEVQQALRMVGDLVKAAAPQETTPQWKDAIDQMHAWISAAKELKQQQAKQYPEFKFNKFTLSNGAEEVL